MTDQPEKFDLSSMDVAAEQREKLKSLFPEAITEGGKVDFERLKMTLGEMVDGREEALPSDLSRCRIPRE
jgi:adenine-specific DNA-methyltransferase